jgi:hypothetical protein
VLVDSGQRWLIDIGGVVGEHEGARAHQLVAADGWEMSLGLLATSTGATSTGANAQGYNLSFHMTF